MPSNVGPWKEPYFYVHDVQQVPTIFNYLPVGQVRTPLTGTAKATADEVITLPRDRRNIRKLLTTANLIEYGFLKLGARTTPQPKVSTSKPATKRATKKRKGKEPAHDGETECPLYHPCIMYFIFIAFFIHICTYFHLSIH